MARRQQSPKVSEFVRDDVEERLTAHVKSSWPDCHEIKVRRHGQFVYVDARSGDAEEMEPLLRLRYLGDIEDWELAFFTWSRETYEPCLLSNGAWSGTPEDCFDTAAAVMPA